MSNLVKNLTLENSNFINNNLYIDENEYYEDVVFGTILKSIEENMDFLISENKERTYENIKNHSAELTNIILNTTSKGVVFETLDYYNGYEYKYYEENLSDDDPYLEEKLSYKDVSRELRQNAMNKQMTKMLVSLGFTGGMHTANMILGGTLLPMIGGSIALIPMSIGLSLAFFPIMAIYGLMTRKDKKILVNFSKLSKKLMDQLKRKDKEYKQYLDKHSNDIVKDNEKCIMEKCGFKDDIKKIKEMKGQLNKELDDLKDNIKQKEKEVKELKKDLKVVNDSETKKKYENAEKKLEELKNEFKEKKESLKKPEKKSKEEIKEFESEVGEKKAKCVLDCMMVTININVNIIVNVYVDYLYKQKYNIDEIRSASDLFNFYLDEKDSKLDNISREMFITLRNLVNLVYKNDYSKKNKFMGDLDKAIVNKIRNVKRGKSALK